MKRSRETLLSLGLILLVLALTIFGAIQRARQEARLPLLSSFSNEPNGGRALYLWLEDLGHPMDNEPLGRYQIAAGTEVVLLLNPLYEIRDDEWEKLEQWLQDGGTLLVAGNSTYTRLLSERLEVAWFFRFDPQTELGAAQAGLSIPAPGAIVDSPADCVLRPQSGARLREVSILLASRDGPAALTFRHGQGRVILSCAPALLTNLGLKDPTAAALASNLLALLPAGGPIWVDEWHHGERTSATQANLENGLRRTPAGRALLYGVLVLLLALVAGGFRLGKPLLAPLRLTRRGPLEHVTALANLNRRAGHSRAVLEYHRQALKRRYGRRYRIDPALPDADFIAALERCCPSLPLVGLADLLQRLSLKHPGEVEMIRLTAEAADWLERTPKTIDR